MMGATVEQGELVNSLNITKYENVNVISIMGAATGAGDAFPYTLKRAGGCPPQLRRVSPSANPT